MVDNTQTEDQGDYASLLQRSWKDVPEPVDTPDGTWLLKTKAAKFQPAETVQKKNGEDVDLSDRIMFVYVPSEAMDDVDAKALEEAGDFDFSENPIFHTFWLRKRSDWDDLREHLALHDVEVTDESTLQDNLKDVKGTEVLGYLKQKPYVQDGVTKSQTTIVSFAKPE